MDEEQAGESHRTDEQAHHVCGLDVPELRDHKCPEDGTAGLHGEYHAYPVACVLICLGGRVGHSAPAVIGQGAVGIGPHVEERRPAEELHEADGPEGLRGLHQQFHEAFLGLLLLFFEVDPVELGILLRGHFPHLDEGVHHTGYEDGGTHVEGSLHRIRHHSLGSFVGYAYPGEEDGQEIAHEASGVAEEALDGISLGLLFFGDHVSNHHLEGLHGHVDAGIQEDEAEQAEPHRGVESEQDVCGGEIQAACVGQEAHHQHGDDRAYQQIGLAAAEAAPGTVGPFADERLDQHAHERGQYPEERQLVRIGSQGGEDPAYIGALKCIGDLDSEETEAQIDHLHETQFRLMFHFNANSGTSYLFYIEFVTFRATF